MHFKQKYYTILASLFTFSFLFSVFAQDLREGQSMRDYDLPDEVWEAIAEETGLPFGVMPHGDTKAYKAYREKMRKEMPRVTSTFDRLLAPPEAGYRAPAEIRRCPLRTGHALRKIGAESELEREP